jgi:hypothetical protein
METLDQLYIRALEIESKLSRAVSPNHKQELLAEYATLIDAATALDHGPLNG